MSFATSLLSIGPVVSRDGTKLKARTSTFFALLTLGANLKLFEADTATRRIHFHRRLFWVFARSWDVAFEEVVEVKYGYENLNPFAFISADDATDDFFISLEMRDRSSIALFHWIGEGEFTNNTILPDWWFFGETLFDATGTQQKESMTFYEVLTAMLKPRLRPERRSTTTVPIGPKTLPILPKKQS